MDVGFGERCWMRDRPYNVGYEGGVQKVALRIVQVCFFRCHILHMRSLMQELSRYIFGHNDLASLFRDTSDTAQESSSDASDALKLSIRILCARW